MDLGAEGGAKRRNQTQSDGKIFAEEESDCVGEVSIWTKVIKYYKFFFSNTFRIDTIFEIFLIVMRAPKPLLVTGSKEVAEGSGLPGCCGVSLH
jgi:hypothetical protein